MKKITKLISVIGFILCLSACQEIREVSYEQLRGGFTNLPDSIQTSVYWHWISGNISKEGVIKDLESMKQAGINRAFIANIGLSAAEAPTGDVQIFSDEWWEILHAALKKGNRAEYRNRYLQLSGMESGRRSVDQAGAVHAVSGICRHASQRRTGNRSYVTQNQS